MLDELCMSFLEDKKSSLKSILHDITTNNNSLQGLNKFIDNIDDASMTEENIRKKFKTMMKVTKSQNLIIQKLLILSLVYMQGSNFDVDVGHMLNKMGRGEEALHAMFKNKMSGK